VIPDSSSTFCLSIILKNGYQIITCTPTIINCNNPADIFPPLAINAPKNAGLVHGAAIPGNFATSPVVAVTLAYFGMKTGLVAKLPGIAAPWTSPAFFGAFIASGGKISAGLLQLIIVGVQVIIWYPFFKIMDKQKVEEESGITAELEKASA
jgi:PTS system cellobiose-specific IIC component